MSVEPFVDLSIRGKELGPFCPWYVDDFIAGTQLYNATMIGAYHLLLLHQWSYGYIPRDMDQCQIIARCDRNTLERILDPDSPETPKFVLHSCGGLINRRMAEVRIQRHNWIQEQRRKGSLGGKAKAKAEAVAPATSVDMAAATAVGVAFPSPSPSSSSYPGIPHTPAGAWSLDDFRKAAEGIAMKAQEIEDCYHHYAAVDFVDAAGRKITNVKSLLAKWKKNQPSHGTATGRRRLTAREEMEAETAKIRVTM